MAGRSARAARPVDALDAHANAAAKGLRQGLGLAELMRVDFATSQHGEGDVLVHGARERLGARGERRQLSDML